MENRQIAVGWNHINVIRLYLHAVLGLQYGHGCCSLQQFGQHAGLRRVKMLDNDKGHATGWHYVGKKLSHRFKSTRRGADADNREGARGRSGWGFNECGLGGAGLLFWVWHGRLFSIYFFLMKPERYFCCLLSAVCCLLSECCCVRHSWLEKAPARHAA